MATALVDMSRHLKPQVGVRSRRSRRGAPRGSLTSVRPGDGGRSARSPLAIFRTHVLCSGCRAGGWGRSRRSGAGRSLHLFGRPDQTSRRAGTRWGMKAGESGRARGDGRRSRSRSGFAWCRRFRRSGVLATTAPRCECERAASISPRPCLASCWLGTRPASGTGGRSRPSS